MKEESTQSRTNGGNAQILAALDHCLNDAHLGVQIHLRLIVIADMDVRPKLNLALIWRNFAQ